MRMLHVVQGNVNSDAGVYHDLDKTISDYSVLHTMGQVEMHLKKVEHVVVSVFSSVGDLVPIYNDCLIVVG